jgi:DNA polymerase-3 subunit epsilon
MERLGRRPITKPIFCTMNAYRQKGLIGGASLSAICQKLDLARTAKLHGALEDAWLAMRVYLWLNNSTFSARLPPEFTGDPTNLKPAPPLPTGPLPRRQRKKIVAGGGETTSPVCTALPPAVLQ